MLVLLRKDDIPSSVIQNLNNNFTTCLVPKNCLIVGDFAIFMYSSGTLKIVQDHGHKNQGEIHLIKYRTVHEFSLAPLMRAPHKAVRSHHTRAVIYS